MAFNQKRWPIWKQCDQDFQNFHWKESFERNFTAATFTTLTTKQKKTKKLGYRLISLLGRIYNIIAKTHALFREIIMDVVLLANECLDSRMRLKEAQVIREFELERRMIISTKKFMKAMGIVDKQISWIKNLVNPSCSICNSRQFKKNKISQLKNMLTSSNGKHLHLLILRLWVRVTKRANYRIKANSRTLNIDNMKLNTTASLPLKGSLFL